jgi:hypothetical protein
MAKPIRLRMRQGAFRAPGAKPLPSGDPGSLQIGFDFDLGPFQRALQQAPRRVADISKRVLHRWATQFVTEAKAEGSRIFTKQKDTDRREGLVQGIYAYPRGTEPMQKGKALLFQIKWSVPYGYILEWGPRKKIWEIKPKRFKALRIPGWQFTVVRGPGGAAKMQQNVVYFKKVVHRWTKWSLRPHMRPAGEKIRPGFIKDMSDVPGAALEGR